MAIQWGIVTMINHVEKNQEQLWCLPSKCPDTCTKSVWLITTYLLFNFKFTHFEGYCLHQSLAWFHKNHFPQMQTPHCPQTWVELQISPLQKISWTNASVQHQQIPKDYLFSVLLLQWVQSVNIILDRVIYMSDSFDLATAFPPRTSSVAGQTRFTADLI